MDEETILMVNRKFCSFGEVCPYTETYKDIFEALRIVDKFDKENKLFRFDLLSKFCQLTYLKSECFDIDRGRVIMKFNLPELSIEKIALIMDAIETVMNSEEYKSAS